MTAYDAPTIFAALTAGMSTGQKFDIIERLLGGNPDAPKPERQQVRGRTPNLSIHPRSWPAGYSEGPEKSRSCTKARRVRTVTAAQYDHAERHPKDAVAKARIAKIEAGRA